MRYAEPMRNAERIRTVLEAGLGSHGIEAGAERYHEAVEALGRGFEQMTKLSLEAEGVHLARFEFELAGKDPDDSVSIAYRRRHSGLFPFPHDHCTVTICVDTVIDGKPVRVCIEVEYPCNIDWPIIGRL